MSWDHQRPQSLMSGEDNGYPQIDTSKLYNVQSSMNETHWLVIFHLLRRHKYRWWKSCCRKKFPFGIILLDLEDVSDRTETIYFSMTMQILKLCWILVESLRFFSVIMSRNIATFNSVRHRSRVENLFLSFYHCILWRFSFSVFLYA